MSSSALAQVCDSSGVDVKITVYVQKACSQLLSKSKKIIDNPKATNIFKKALISLNGETGSSILVFDFGQAGYKFKDHDFGNSYWGVDFMDVNLLAHLNYHFIDLLRIAAREAGDDRAMQIGRLKNVVALVKNKNLGEYLVFDTDGYAIKGDVIYINGNQNELVGRTRGLMFFFNSKPQKTDFQGRTFLTPAGQAARFLGIRYK